MAMSRTLISLTLGACFATAYGCEEDGAAGPPGGGDADAAIVEAGADVEVEVPPFESSADHFILVNRGELSFARFEDQRIVGVEPVFDAAAQTMVKLAPNHRWAALRDDLANEVLVRDLVKRTPAVRYANGTSKAVVFFVDDDGHLYREIRANDDTSAIWRDDVRIARGFFLGGFVDHGGIVSYEYARSGAWLASLGDRLALVDAGGNLTSFEGVLETLEWAMDGQCVRIDDESAVSHRICTDGTDVELGVRRERLWMAPDASWFVEDGASPRVLDLTSGTLVERTTNAPKGTVLFAPDSARAYVLGEKEVWSVERADPENAIKLTPNTAPSGQFFGGIFGPEGALVLLELSPAGRTLWTVEGSSLTRLYPAITSEVEVSFAPKARRLLVRGDAWLECELATNTCAPKATSAPQTLQWLDEDSYVFSAADPLAGAIGIFGSRWSSPAFSFENAPAGQAVMFAPTSCWRPFPNGVACLDQVRSVP